jgi:phage tail-like protein
MPTRPRSGIVDPYMSFRFKIVINGIIEGAFTEATGLQVTTQVEDFREGGVNHFVHKLPKETTFDNLVLKKGLADSDELWQWHKEVVAGKFTRRNIQILMFNSANKKVHDWMFQKAFPVKWTGPEFKADSNTVAFQTLEIVHQGYV